MDLYSEVIRIKPYSKEADELRDQAVSGDANAGKKYLYYCAYRKILSDPFIPMDKKRDVFKALCQADLVEVISG